jgi:hypothetical protein
MATSTLGALIQNGWGDMPGPLRKLAEEACPTHCYCGGDLVLRGRQGGKIRKTRLSCKKCGAGYTQNRFVSGARYLQPKQVAQLAKLYIRGESGRRAAKIVGVPNWRTVCRLFITFRAMWQQPNCPCGRLGSHKGSCWYRSSP